MKKVKSTTAKIPVKDEWVTAAMTNNHMVAELLIRLKHADTVVSESSPANLPPSRWGNHQRRSKSSRFGGGGGGVLVSSKREVDSVRASPKTPFSWSDGSGSRGGSASPSAATADGFEDNSLKASCSTSSGSRSKVPSPSRDSAHESRSSLLSIFLLLDREICSDGDIQIGFLAGIISPSRVDDFSAYRFCIQAFRNGIAGSFSKRSKKMKNSSDELKEVEKLRLKEMIHLDNKLSSLSSTLNEIDAENEMFKRIKLDLKSKKPCRVVESKINNSKENQNKSFFFLPDLNMVPSDDDIIVWN
ncbi:unnamed protein product [Cochlearia groenlandica]